VSGLLTGSDILESFQDISPRGTVILPPNCLNDEGLFLDDLSPADLERELGVEVKSTPREQPFQSLEEVWS
jgi:NifB/MoaA-like Fe-S oxidoreductase